MSASMYLYKVNKDVYILPSESHKYSSKNFKKMEKENLEKFLEIDYSTNWSDGLINYAHRKISITYLRQLYRMGMKTYTFKHLKNFSKYFKTLCLKGYAETYLPVDVLSHWQGGDLKNSFFNRKMTFVYCVNKKQMYKFMYRYVKPKLYKTFKEKFIDKMVEGEMIFECAW